MVNGFKEYYQLLMNLLNFLRTVDTNVSLEEGPSLKDPELQKVLQIWINEIFLLSFKDYEEISRALD